MKGQACRRAMAGCVLLLGFVVAGCGVSRPPPVRVATATATELEAASERDVVWYEFRQGDVVRFQPMYFGVAEGGAQAPALVRATQTFYLVFRRNLPMRISFDGESLAGDRSSQTIVTIMPNDSGRGGQVAWMTYLGPSHDARAELRKLLESAEEPAPEPSH